jgi:hypothetical protein
MWLDIGDASVLAVVEEPVFAVSRHNGRWSVLAPCRREHLRMVHRIAVIGDPDWLPFRPSSSSAIRRWFSAGPQIEHRHRVVRFRALPGNG